MSSTEKGKQKHTTPLRNRNMTKKKIALYENKLNALKCTEASWKVEVNPFSSTASRSIVWEWSRMWCMLSGICMKTKVV